MVVVSATVAVASLVGASLIFFTHSAGSGLGDRIDSLVHDDVALSQDEADREELMAASRTFVLRFNTYGPDMLDSEGHLPDYAAVSDLMTAKFATVFDQNVGYAETTVQKLGASRSAKVYAVGVASQDADSAEVLVAGTVELSYPYPDQLGQQTTDDPKSGDSQGAPQVTSGPQRFRYQVSLVKVGGKWLVDDLDDVDDGLPPFSQPATPEDGQTGAPPASPSDGSPAPGSGGSKGSNGSKRTQGKGGKG